MTHALDNGLQSLDPSTLDSSPLPFLLTPTQTEIAWNIGGSPIVGHLPIIRCLPNVACAVRAGVTVYSRGKYCNDTDTKPFTSLFSLLGYCEEVEEQYMDAFTALSGSGIAYVSDELR